jgi:hypothetical protein
MREYTIHEGEETLVLKCPFFSEDPVYKAEMGWSITENDRRALWNSWRESYEKIEECTASLPEKQKDVIRKTLRLIRNHQRRYAERKACTIRWFLKKIKQERIRLGALRRAAKKPTLFPTCVPTNCDTVQEQLDRAENIVQEARQVLEPARKFLVNRKAPSRREAKRVILHALQSVKEFNRNSAAKLTQQLLDLADPERSARHDTLRKLSY